MTRPVLYFLCADQKEPPATRHRAFQVSGISFHAVQQKGLYVNKGIVLLSPWVLSPFELSRE